MDKDQLTVKLYSIEDVSIILEPDGDVGDKIASGIVWPVAQLLVTIFKDKIKSSVEGYTYSNPFKPALGYGFSVEGVNIKAEPDKIALSTYNGMLLATSDITVKAV